MKFVFSMMVCYFAGFAALFAQSAPAAAPAAAPGFDSSSLVGIALMIAVFFFLIILPQSRRQKKHNEFLKSLKKGDAVVTNAGLYGRIYGIADRVITLEIAQNVRIRIDRQTIAALDPTGGDEKAAA